MLHVSLWALTPKESGTDYVRNGIGKALSQ